MMTNKTLRLVSLLSLLSTLTYARFLQTQPTSTDYTVAFASTLGCGDCVIGGFIYCVKGNENWEVTAPLTSSNGVCCKDKSSCSFITNNQYNCTSAYANSTYSKHVCPFNKNQCGSSSDLVLDSINS